MVKLAAACIGSCDAAAVTLVGKESRAGPVCTDAIAHHLDEAQLRAGGGPSIDAVRFLQIFNVGAIARAPTWPEFREAAAESGIKSSLSIPLVQGGIVIGMLNLYSTRVNGFHGSEATAATFSAGAAAVLARSAATP